MRTKFTGDPAPPRTTLPNFFALTLAVAIAMFNPEVGALAADEPGGPKEEVPIVTPNGAMNLSPKIGDFAIYGERSVRVGAYDVVAGGDIGVHTPAPANFGSQLRIGAHASTVVEKSNFRYYLSDDRGVGGHNRNHECQVFRAQRGRVGSTSIHSLLSPSVAIGYRALVGDVQTSFLENYGGRFGVLAPFPATMMPPEDLVGSAGGGADIVVRSYQSVTLPPGRYGALNALRDSTVLLDAGIYEFANVTLGDHARLFNVSASGSVEMRIGNRFVAGAESRICPTRGAADKLSIRVFGEDGPYGKAVAAKVGTGSRFVGLLSVPRGTLVLEQGVRAAGALAGFDIKLEEYVVLLFESGLPASATGQRQLSGYLKPRASGAPVVGPVPRDAVTEIMLGLPVRDAAGLKSFVDRVSNPSSPDFRRYLTPDQFTATYGATSADYQALVDFASSNGFAIKATFPSRLALRVEATAAVIAQTLFANLNLYERPDGSRFFALDREPSINLAFPILRISGLDNFVVAAPRARSGSGPSGTYQGKDFRNAYLGTAPSCTALTGAGQSIGIFAADGFNPADIQQYFAKAGLPNVTVIPLPIAIATAGSPTSNQNTRREVALDIEMAGSMAPGAQINVVMAANIGGTEPTNDILWTLATPPLANQISISWAGDTDDNTSQALSALAAQGQSILKSSGDTGAFFQGFPGDELMRAISNVGTIVGGTVLTMNGVGGSYNSETAWPGSEGGILGCQAGPICDPSLDVPLPYYQKGLANSANGASVTWRNAPDVSAVASEVNVFVNGANTATAKVSTVGTSVAAPIWAGFMALVNEQGQRNNLPPVGFVTPALYGIAGTAAYANSFNDVTAGGNGFFQAVSGYDLTTGLGSPQCGLVFNLVGGNAPPPPPPPPGGGSVTVNATETQAGPRLCVTGKGLLAGAHATSSYSGIPGRTAPLGGRAGTVNPDGTLDLGRDTSTEFLVAQCSDAQINSSVQALVTLLDNNSNVVGGASDIIPGAFWCDGDAPSQTFQGGCP